MESITGLGKIDRLILGAALAGALVSAFLLQRDFSGAGSKSSGEPIGHVVGFENEVQRKEAKKLVWESLSENDFIFDRDSVYTGSGASIELSITGQGEVSVGPESLVIITRQAQGATLDLQVGQLFAKLDPGKSLVVNAEGGPVTLESKSGGQISLMKDEKKALKIASTKGEVRAKTSQGAATIKAGSEVRLNKGKTESSPSYPVQLLSPFLGQTVYPKEGTLGLKWRGRDLPAQTALQVARSANFRTLLHEASNASENYDWPVNKQTGAMYWRLVDKIKNEPLSPVGMFRLNEGNTFVPLFPRANTTLLAPSSSGLALRLKWRATVPGSLAEVQLAKDSNFSQLVLNENRMRAQSSPVKLAPGTYYWRLGAREDQDFVWSKAYPFNVKAEDKPVAPVAPVAPPTVAAPPPTPPAASASPSASGSGSQMPALKAEGLGVDTPSEPTPEATAPAEASAKPEPTPTPASAPAAEPVVAKALPAPTISSVPSSMTVSEAKPATMNWKSVPEAKAYDIEIARDPNFKDVVKKDTSNNPRYAWKGAPPGNYFWRVLAKGAEGVTSPPSAAQKLSIKVPPPNVKPVEPIIERVSKAELNSKAPKALDVAWNEVPQSKNYRVELSQNDKVLNTQDYTGTNGMVTLPGPGQYDVRVAALTPNKRELASVYSPKQSLDYRKALLLKVPQGISPEKGLNVVSFPGMPLAVIFEWSRVPDADGYELELSENSDFLKPAVRTKVKSNRWILAKPLKTNKVYWRVRATGLGEQSVWSSVRDFSIAVQN